MTTTNANPSLAEIWAEVHNLRVKKGADRAWDVAVKIAVPLVLIVSGWMISMQVKMSVMESNRFTKADGESLRNDLNASHPQQWLKDSLQEIKDRLQRLEERK